MTAPIASGWSESPGGACTHWKAPPLHGARRRRPLSNARSIRGLCGRDVPMERRGGDTEALRDLNDGDVGISPQRIAAARKLQRLAQRWSIRDRARQSLGEDLPASCLGKRVPLQDQVLEG